MDQSFLFLILKKGNAWTEIKLAAGSELLKGVTRLAVNSKGDKLAVVVSE